MSEFEDEREQMTQAEWEEMQNDLRKHLKDVEDRFWQSVQIKAGKRVPKKRG